MKKIITIAFAVVMTVIAYNCDASNCECDDASIIGFMALGSWALALGICFPKYFGKLFETQD